MNIKDLFKIEEYLEADGTWCQHLDLKDKMMLKDALEPSRNGVWDSYLLQGMIIYIFPEDEEYAEYLFQGLLKHIPNLQYSSELLKYRTIDEDWRIVITVHEELD